MIEFQIEELLNNEFLDRIDDECSDYISNLNGAELIEYFDVIVDFAILDVIENIVLTNYKSEHIQGQDEITGSALAYVEARGYAHYSGEDLYVGTEIIKLNIDFLFYKILRKVEDFTILSIERV